MHTTDNAVYRDVLTEAELQAIRTLETVGNEKGITYKIDPGLNSGIAYCSGGKLAGFMTTDCFGGKDMESAAVTGSAADWDAMKDALFTHAREMGAERVLFIVDPADALVLGRIKSLVSTPLFSEYRMVFDAAAFRPVPIHGISIRPSVAEDRSIITELDVQAFGCAVPMSDNDFHNTWIVTREERPVGKLRMDVADGLHGIYGVVIDAQLRGQGIGAQAMTLALQDLLKSGAGHIYLEVASENPAAFHLYKKLGFKVQSEFQYYPYPL